MCAGQRGPQCVGQGVENERGPVREGVGSDAGAEKELGWPGSAGLPCSAIVSAMGLRPLSKYADFRMRIQN